MMKFRLNDHGKIFNSIMSDTQKEISKPMLKTSENSKEFKSTAIYSQSSSSISANKKVTYLNSGVINFKRI